MAIVPDGLHSSCCAAPFHPPMHHRRVGLPQNRIAEEPGPTPLAPLHSLKKQKINVMSRLQLHRNTHLVHLLSRDGMCKLECTVVTTVRVYICNVRVRRVSIRAGGAQCRPRLPPGILKTERRPQSLKRLSRRPPCRTDLDTAARRGSSSDQPHSHHTGVVQTSSR